MRRIVLEIPEESFANGSEIVLRLSKAGGPVSHIVEADGLPTAAPADCGGFAAFIGQEAARCAAEGHVRTAETYRAAAASLLRFRAGEDVAIGEVDATLMSRYSDFLRERRLMPNTVSFYLRRLNALYGRAVACGLTRDARPFEGVTMRRVGTAKRALPLADLRRLVGSCLESAGQREARDMFLFSFFTRGMAFVDMAALTRDNVADGQLSYRRHKTGQLLRIRWLPCMQRIVDRYCPASFRLLPLVPDGCADELHAYRASQRRTGRYLLEVGRRIGIPQLTMYCARHSWATAAQELDVPTSVISSGMGHESERTTRIYLAQVSAGKVDAANERVLESLLGPAMSISRRGD